MRNLIERDTIFDDPIHSTSVCNIAQFSVSKELRKIG